MASGPETDRTATPDEQNEARRLVVQGYELLASLWEITSTAEAIKICDRALELFKRARGQAEDDLEARREATLGLAATYSQRGHQHRYARNQAEALADLSQGLRLNPAQSEDYYYRAMSYLHKNDARLAKADLVEYLKRGENAYLRELARNRLATMAPAHEDARASLAHWRDQGVHLNSEAANAAHPREEQAQPDWPRAVAIFNKAIEMFNRALEINPGDTFSKLGMLTALIEQAEGYRWMEEYDLALANYERAQQVRFDPRQVFLRGETLLEAGHPQLARAAFEEFLTRSNDTAQQAQAREYLQSINRQKAGS